MALCGLNSYIHTVKINTKHFSHDNTEFIELKAVHMYHTVVDECSEIGASIGLCSDTTRPEKELFMLR